MSLYQAHTGVLIQLQGMYRRYTNWGRD